MKRALPILVIIFITACGASPAAPTVDVGTLQTQAVASVIAQVTQNAPTSTPQPTRTPAPTWTPRPTVTNTPEPQPIMLTGTGDSIVDFVKWQGIALAKIKHAGGRNFVVRNYPANSGDYYELLVNTIGAYEGTVVLDAFDNEHTARFEVIADGTWEIQVLPFSNVRLQTIPGVIQGVGDDVILIGGDNADLLKVDASQATSNFVVYAVRESGIRDLVVNEIAPYTGTVIIDPSIILITVTAEGPWSLEITTR